MSYFVQLAASTHVAIFCYVPIALTCQSIGGGPVRCTPLYRRLQNNRFVLFFESITDDKRQKNQTYNPNSPTGPAPNLVAVYRSYQNQRKN